MQHVHGPSCGCHQYLNAQNANDLFGAIDLDNIRCLNQKNVNTGKLVFKPVDEKFDKSKYVASDCDGQILLIVPFTSQVKVRAVTVIARSQNKCPNQLRLYINTQNINFSLTESQPVQQFAIPANLSGEISNAVKISKFGNVHKLIIHLRNQNQQSIEVSYIQITGQNTNVKRQAVQTVYEVQPNAKKNDMKEFQKNTFQMG